MSESSPDKGSLAFYAVGDRDTRPWGHYEVTAVGHNAAGEEICEKRITVKPGQVLSLQSHALRREHWAVEQGVLTVLQDGAVFDLTAGQDVRLPVGSIHCMANATGTDVVVREVQEGICREGDIVRYQDAYGRAAAAGDDPAVAKSLAAYQALLARVAKA